MCGISAIVAGRDPVERADLQAMNDRLRHRGPDDEGLYCDEFIGLGSRRLSIIDLSAAGHQPMTSLDGRFRIVFNGEIYNYLELRSELGAEDLRSDTDTEVLLRAYERWGPGCLHKLNGMFAFIVWDSLTHTLFAARDRFGVKPLYYATEPGRVMLASEIKALFAAGLPRRPDLDTWRDYLVFGLYEHSTRTFFEGVRQLAPGHYLEWKDDQLASRQYYDLGDRVCQAEDGPEPEAQVVEQYRRILQQAVELRLRADVPVGICLSGGLDSSTLLRLVELARGADRALNTFTYTCGDPRYDERPWVEELCADASYPCHFTLLTPEEVPDLSRRVQDFEDEPFGGLNTLGLAKVCEMAKRTGVTVLLDGQGLDEQWAGYDYYARALGGNGNPAEESNGMAPPTITGPVQATTSPAVHPECLTPEFAGRARPSTFGEPFTGALRNLRYRDVRHTKIPRALRFSDRVSMMYSVELREPFLDYRLVELAFRQPDNRLIRNGVHKYLLRRIVAPFLPDRVQQAPKRPLHTPQREWLAGPLRSWVEDLVRSEPFLSLGWFDERAVAKCWSEYLAGASDNSFYVWQWVNVALMFGR